MEKKKNNTLRFKIILYDRFIGVLIYASHVSVVKEQKRKEHNNIF